MDSKTEWVDRSTVVSTVLLEWANVNQLMRMWGERTSAGQSVIAWCSVWLALAIFANFYRVKQLRLPMYGALVGMCINSTVIGTVVYFRYFAQ